MGKRSLEYKPDVILIDTSLTNIDAFELMKTISSQLPLAKIITLTHSQASSDLYASLEAGARAYVSKSTSMESLIQIIRLVNQGTVIISQPVSEGLLSKFTSPNVVLGQEAKTVALTRQEQLVLSLVEQGSTNKDIASTLVISEHTVKVHMRNIMEKLHANTRQQAIFFAKDQGLLNQAH
ncbi:MAG: response regulator transcription factor [Dehalococcoidaceae bacterium]|nr:response regulator transcription factor [Dehalococcoidaceae bacterium]